MTGPHARPWECYSQGERKVLLLVLFLVGTSSYVDRNVVSVVLESIKAEFRVSDTLLGLLSGPTFALLYATLGIPVARWADRGDRKHVITRSLCIWSLATVFCGMAKSFSQLAVARFGVGAAEAGTIPPAQSLIADYYPPAERARAIGLFMTSGAAGYVLGLMLGGIVAQYYGWRAAFWAFGLPGLLLAPVASRVLKEPRRTQLGMASFERSESNWTAIRALLVKPSYRNIVGGIVVYFLMAYGALIFVVSLMIRVHGLSVVKAGVIFGGTSAIGVLVGSIGGGAIADRMAARDITWLTRLSGWGVISTFAIYELAFWSPSLTGMTIFLLVGGIVLAAVLPPAFSALHVVCGSSRRALAVALALFFANLIGLGLGPVIAGSLSDRLGSIYGAGDGLRYALMIVTPLLLPAGWLLLRGARTLKRDAEE